jgi:hypothetical protein
VGKIVLLAVAAAWVAVLLPPLLRSRMENRPGSSVTDFRRQLSTLERTVPTRSVGGVRSMARPLTSSPLQRPAATGRPGQPGRVHLTSVPADRPSMWAGEPVRRVREHGDDTGSTRRAPQISRREAIRRRRTNVLFVLVITVGMTLFLAATTQSQAMVYAFALAFVSLCGYCYKLAQLRQWEQDRTYGESSWFNAA